MAAPHREGRADAHASWREPTGAENSDRPLIRGQGSTLWNSLTMELVFLHGYVKLTKGSPKKLIFLK